MLLLRVLSRFTIRLSRSSGFKYTVLFFVFLNGAALTMLFSESGNKAGQFTSFIDALWFSIVTITTVGYGDMSPTSLLGRIFSIGIMFVGIMFFGAFTGSITTWLVELNRKRTLGLVPLKGLKNHFLIFGWDENMPGLLKDILTLNKDLYVQDIVLVNDADYKLIDELRRFPEFRYIKYVSGDITNKNILKHACIETASTALVVVNNDEGTGEQADAQTVITVATIKNLNPKIYLSAEIINQHFSQYMRRLKVHKVILSEYYSRILMIRAAVFPGSYATIHSLFNLKDGSLSIKSIPSQFIDSPFENLKEEFEKDACRVLGLLENVGNLGSRKRDKLFQAQKNPSIKGSLQSLIEIKKTQNNSPLFQPPDAYTVKEYSQLILLKNNHKPISKEDENKRKSWTNVKNGIGNNIGPLVICGWNSSMIQIIEGILELSSHYDTNWNSIHLVARFPNMYLKELKNHFKNVDQIKFFYGDHVDKKYLLRADIKNASKVIILAETSSQLKSQDIDSRTVVSAMAVEDLNRYAYKIAELLNNRYIDYLHKSNVEEIISLNSFKRNMIANSTNRTGMSNIVFSLLSIENKLFETIKMNNAYIGKTFGELQESMGENGSYLIGIIEQTGNDSIRKQESIREAQFSPNIQKSIEQLKLIRKTESNKVLLVPKKLHILDNYTMLILLKSHISERHEKSTRELKNECS